MSENNDICGCTFQIIKDIENYPNAPRETFPNGEEYIVGGICKCGVHPELSERKQYERGLIKYKKGRDPSFAK